LRKWLLRAGLLTVLACGFALAQESEQPTSGPRNGEDVALLARPYLQLGQGSQDEVSDHLDVLWLALASSTGWSLEYRESTESQWKEASLTKRAIALGPVTPHIVYDATLTHLKPGEPFEYRLLRQNLPVFLGNAIAKSSEGDGYRFAVFGDGGANTQAQKRVAFEVYANKPALLVITGDIVYQSGTAAEYLSNFFPIYGAVKADPEVGAPLLSSTVAVGAPGNHDTNEDVGNEADDLAYFIYWSQPLNGPPLMPGGPNTPLGTDTDITPSHDNADRALANIRSLAGEAYPRMENFSFDWGNSHWTILDSDGTVDWNDKGLRGWVERDLKNSRSQKWHFVAFHHAPFSSSMTHFGDQQMRALSSVFEAGHVDIVFAGHVHNYQRSYPLKFRIVDAEKPGNVPWSELIEKPVDGKIILDRRFDGVTRTRPKGVIYIVTGAGGQDLYNREQENQPQSWQPFTARYVARSHSFTLVDIHGGDLTLKQISDEGRVLDHIRVTK